MTVRLQILLSDEMNTKIEKIAVGRETTKAEILRKAIVLYIDAADGKEKELRAGSAEDNRQLETEFVGLLGEVNLNALPPTTTLSITRKETSGERRVRLFKDVTLFLLALALLCVIVGLCVHTALSTNAIAAAQKN